jgi:zinc D-Ala-D-Ala carboxypeptidase
MRLSEHFTLEELTTTSTGLPNDPNADQRADLARLCELILEPLRSLVGPLHCNSGFRTLAVNSAIGGAHNSQHMLGQAADIRALYDNASIDYIFDTCRAAGTIPFDQLIREPTWVHVSVALVGRVPRKQCLRAHMVNGRMVYEPA